jgi:PAS domain S-box-containing protein
MNQNLRHSGIDIIGDVAWGTHFCQFYQTKEDLLDILIPYFKAGLENNEFCIWVTSEPLGVEEAKEALKMAVSNLNDYIAKKQIEIIPYTDWYLKDGIFDPNRGMNGWVKKLNQAQTNAYDGLRLTGNTFWLEKEDWNGFVDYEEEVDRVIGNYEMIALCTYCLDKCKVTDIINVVTNCQFTIVKQEGRWERIESAKRKETEKTAIQAAKNWEYTIDAVPDLITIIDTEFQIVCVNKAMATKLGMAPEECVGLTCYQVLHGTNDPPSFCPHRKLLADGLEHNVEVHEDSLDGDFIVSVSPLYNSEGKLTGCVHVARDITERKKAEEALHKDCDILHVQSEKLQASNEKLQSQSEELREAYEALRDSEEKYRYIVETTNEGIWVVDAEIRTTYVNKKLVDMLGYSPDELMGSLATDFVDNNYLAYTYSRMGKRQQGIDEVHENKLVRKDGSLLWVLVNSKSLFDDSSKFIGVLAMLTDISERKEAEAKLEATLDNLEEQVIERTIQLEKAYKALKESEQSLTEAQQMAHIGNWDWNLVTNKIHRSDEIYQIYKRKPEEFDAPYSELLSYVHPDDQDFVDNTAKKALNGNPYNIDFRIILPNGEERVVHTQGKAIFDEKNKPFRMKGTVQDITERKRLEKALELVARLPHENPNPVIRLTQGQIINYANPAAQVLLKDWSSTIGLEAPAEITDMAILSLCDGVHRELECTCNGHIYLLNIAPFPQDSYVNLYARDITKHKRLDDKIQILANAVESSNDAIITQSLSGIIESWNKGAEQIYDYSPEEVLGKNISILEPDTHKGEVKQLIEKTKQEKKVQHYETLRQKKNGTIINVSVTLSPVFDKSGNFKAISCIGRDITESIKSKEALRLSNNYNRSLIEASLDPLVTIGHDGKITDVNTSTEFVTGYSRDELIGTDFTDYFTEPENAKKGYQEVFREGLVSDYSLDIRHRNGHITPVLFNASVYKDELGDVIGVFAAARDITERKKAEGILRTKIEELARSNAELEQFAYVSSHDLQEPLRMISSYLQLLQRRYQGKLDDKADKYIYFAVDGAVRMQTLINDLLEFSRVATRAKELEPTDSKFVLNQVLSNLELYLKENKAAVSYDTLPEVIADNTQLAQVFQNLIINGIKFHSEKAPRIYISAEKKENEWLFSVKDNGIGIDPQYSHKIFEVFKRLHRKEEYPGTGIGLAICKKIVERHGGHIWVKSELGKGATFYFTIPINPKEASSYHNTKYPL